MIKDQSLTLLQISTTWAGDNSALLEENVVNVLDTAFIMKENALPVALLHLTLMDKDVLLVKLVKSGMDPNVFLNQLIQLDLLIQLDQ